MARDGSVAPKERINVKFVPATSGQQGEVELPLKMVVLGDFTGQESAVPVEQRKAVNIDKATFGSVMKEMALERTVVVPNRLAEDDPEATLSASLTFSSLQDFAPDAVARQVPELRKLVELREALSALKGPLGNMPAFRKVLSEIIEDPVRRAELVQQLAKEDTAFE